MLPVNVKQLGVDAFVGSAHKWLLGPKGIGLLYLKKESRDRIRSIELSNVHAYSASSGTRNIPLMLGLQASINFQQAIGREEIASRIRELRQRLQKRLEQIPRLRCLTPKQEGLSGGIASFAIERKGLSSLKVWKELETRHQIYVRPTQLTYALVERPKRKPQNYNALRVSTHLFNDDSEIEQLAAALERIMTA